MKISISSFLAGILFSCGLTLSQMINPTKVISFLDISGHWDPSLAFVMGAALTVTFIGYRTVLNRKLPFFVDKFHTLVHLTILFWRLRVVYRLILAL